MASILMSLVRDDERRARAFHCCIVPPHPSSGSGGFAGGAGVGMGRSSSESSGGVDGGDDGSAMS